MKSIWNKIQNDPTFMRQVNGWQTVFWAVMVPVSYVAGLLDSVAYVSILSITALALSALSSWQASRTEVLQDQSEDGLTEDDRKWLVATIKEILSDSDILRREQPLHPVDRGLCVSCCERGSSQSLERDRDDNAPGQYQLFSGLAEEVSADSQRFRLRRGEIDTQAGD